MAGTGIMAGICTSSHPSPYPTKKVGDSPYPYPVNAGDSPSKRGRVRTIPTRTGLFAIYNKRNRCEMFFFFLQITLLPNIGVRYFPLRRAPIHLSFILSEFQSMKLWNLEACITFLFMCSTSFLYPSPKIRTEHKTLFASLIFWSFMFQTWLPIKKQQSL